VISTGGRRPQELQRDPSEKGRAGNESGGWKNGIRKRMARVERPPA